MCVSVSMFRIHVTFVIIINEAAPLISVSFGRRCAIVFLSPHFFMYCPFICAIQSCTTTIAPPTTVNV